MGSTVFLRIRIICSFALPFIVFGFAVNSYAAKNSPEKLANFTVAVIPYMYEGGPEFPNLNSTIREFMFTGEKSIEAYFKAVSNNLVDFTGNLHGDGDVYPLVVLPRDPNEINPTCHIGDKYRVLEQTGLKLNNTYDAIIFIRLDKNTCRFGGHAIGKFADINSGLNYRTIVHELGHVFGLGHFSLKLCKNTTGAVVSFDPDDNFCRLREYGHPYDPMGTSDDGGPEDIRHFSIQSKLIAGFINSDEIAHSVFGGTYYLKTPTYPSQYFNGNKLFQGIAIPRITGLARSEGDGRYIGGSSAYLYLELDGVRAFEVPTGDSNKRRLGISMGAPIEPFNLPPYENYASTPWYLRSARIVAQPEIDGIAKAALGSGEIYTDPIEGITVRYTQIDDDIAKVVIGYTNPKNTSVQVDSIEYFPSPTFEGAGHIYIDLNEPAYLDVKTLNVGGKSVKEVRSPEAISRLPWLDSFKRKFVYEVGGVVPGETINFQLDARNGSGYSYSLVTAVDIPSTSGAENNFYFRKVNHDCHDQNKTDVHNLVVCWETSKPTTNTYLEWGYSKYFGLTRSAHKTTDEYNFSAALHYNDVNDLGQYSIYPFIVYYRIVAIDEAGNKIESPRAMRVVFPNIYHAFLVDEFGQQKTEVKASANDSEPQTVRLYWFTNIVAHSEVTISFKDGTKIGPLESFEIGKLHAVAFENSTSLSSAKVSVMMDSGFNKSFATVNVNW
jgi:hypothetical protein